MVLSVFRVCRATPFGSAANIVLMFGYGDDGGQTGIDRIGQVLVFKIFGFLTDGFECIGNLVGTQHGIFSYAFGLLNKRPVFSTENNADWGHVKSR
jgi:hypothetical protein